MRSSFATAGGLDDSGTAAVIVCTAVPFSTTYCCCCAICTKIKCCTAVALVLRM